MKRKWLFPFIAILLLSPCFIYTDRNDMAMGQETEPDITDESVPGILSYNTKPEEEVSPSSGTIPQDNPDINTTATKTIITLGSTDNDSDLPQPAPTTDEQVPGYQLVANNNEDKDISRTQVEYRYIIHYIDREVVKEVPVEKPVTLRHFASLDELKEWLAADDTNEYIHLFAGEDGVCQASDRFDCDDYALQLQQRAASSGFLLSVTLIKEYGKSHMINLACIGNDIYYIEPQSDEIWFFCTRD